MKKLLFLILLVISLTSCQKNFDTVPDKPKTTRDLVVNPTFDWKTSKEITLNVTGMKGINPEISNTLYVKSSVGDTVYFKDLLIMSNNYTLKFSVPSTETKVILIYGSKTTTIDLLSNTITFDYIVE